MDAAIKSNDLEFFDNIPNHLANLPRGWVVLADRGFAFDALKYPNLNAHITPAFAKNSTSFAQEILEEMWKICMLRWSSETHISFVTDTGCLQDVINYGAFPIVQNAVDWACGLANFNQPLQPPEAYKSKYPQLFPNYESNQPEVVAGKRRRGRPTKSGHCEVACDMIDDEDANPIPCDTIDILLSNGRSL